MDLFTGVSFNDLKGLGRTREYHVWGNMMARCYTTRIQEKQPTYKGCTVSDEFLIFSGFYNWYQKQYGADLNFEIDKDLLFKGNKEYHPDKCVLLPKEINSSLITRKKMRGNLPIGVSLSQSGSFIAMMNIGGATKYLGTFKTPEQAFQAYKQAKENHIKLLAEKYRDQIDPRAYEALLNYKVEITD